MKISICGVYHFHMNKLYCEATVEERIILYFSVPASRDCSSLGIQWTRESGELNSAHQTCLFPYVTWWLFRVKSFFSFLCPICPVFFLHACLVEAIDAFLVLADSRCGFACQGLGSLWILQRLLPAPTKLDFICPARLCISPECISTAFQKFFRSFFHSVS